MNLCLYVMFVMLAIYVVYCMYVCMYLCTYICICVSMLISVDLRVDVGCVFLCCSSPLRQKTIYLDIVYT